MRPLDEGIKKPEAAGTRAYIEVVTERYAASLLPKNCTSPSLRSPGRARDPYKSRHYEAALRSSKSDDATTPGARFGYDHSRKWADDPQLRTDQASCGAVGGTGNVRAVRMTPDWS